MRSCITFSTLALLSACSHQPASSTTPQHANAAAHTAITQTIAALDSAMFSAFNAHDAAALGTFFTPDLEFYHDKSGLAGYDSTMAGFRRMFSQPTTADIQREMLPGTLEVYPIGEFGLLEICQHRFCHTQNGKGDCATFRNIMVWRKEGASYKVSRVSSYDH